MSKKVLITGGAGFIGSHLALYLLKNGFEVAVLDNLSPQIHGSDPEKTSPLYISIKDKVDFFNGSVTSSRSVLSAIKGCDAIVHLAAETGTGQSMYDIKSYCYNNVYGLSVLLDILVNRRHTISKVILASSRAIYGEGKYLCSQHGVVFPDGRRSEMMDQGDFECKCPYCDQTVDPLPTDENSLPKSVSVYAVTKFSQEQLIESICENIGIDYTIFRYQNVYGPGQSLINPYTGILSIFSSLIRNNKRINIFEDGMESRDFVYIDDVVHVTASALMNPASKNNIYNVGTGTRITVLEVVEILSRSLGKSPDFFISKSYRKGDIRHAYADISSAQNDLGFSPAVQFEQGIDKYIHWLSEHRVDDIGYEKSIKELQLKGLFKTNV